MMRRCSRIGATAFANLKALAEGAAIVRRELAGA
jgi:hypothetical protein